MLVVEIFAIVGTAAFAVSGALVGIKNKLDLFGVYVLAIITSTGGGLIRDIIISKEYPVFFTNPILLISITVSTLLVMIAFKHIRRILFLIQVFDAAGLGVFTIIAAYKSIEQNVPVIGVFFVATITGIGGGILRDILVNEIPLVFRSEIYAMAAIAGAGVFYGIHRLHLLEVNTNVYLCICIVFVIRLASIYFNINVPPVKVKESEVLLHGEWKKEKRKERRKLGNRK